MSEFISEEEYDKLFSIRYFLKKPWTIELIGEESYKRWKKKNPEFKLSYKEYLRYWDEIIVPGIEELVANDTNGLELPLYLGTLSVKKLEKEFRCEKDMPKLLKYNEETNDFDIKPLPIMSSTVCAITWKKNRRNMNVPSLFGMDVNSVLKKNISNRITKNGDNIYQLPKKSEPIKSKCEPYVDKSLFDIV